jgi:ATP-binding cassette subfamily F protein uup
MPLLRLKKVSVSFGTHVLLDQVDLVLKAGDKIGLLGRNGTGKSTLIKVIAGLTKPDSGERWLRSSVKVAMLDQVLPQADDQTVYDVVASGLHEIGDLLKRFHHIIQDADADLNELERIQQQLEAKDGWRLQQKVESVLSQLQLPADVYMSDLSGGWRRRVALAKALVLDPDILLLDEPTNHLDIPAIEWLQQQLRDYRGVLVFVTHDREFLQQVANKIVELDRGHLSLWEGDYQGFLRLREQELAAEDKANSEFDKKLAQEEVWIRQGIKARRTRNEGRVRALEAMRNERSQRRERVAKANFKIEAAERAGKIVAEVKNVSFVYAQETIIDNFSTVIMQGDRIGIVGANGAGKTTLIKLLLGQITPQRGSVKLGTKLEIAYFDQLRENLDPEKDLIENICGGREFIEIDGKSRHAISYLGDFLFSPQRSRTPVKALSGGEQNRAILAKLFSKPANVLVLDEPTNDLDIETLELLEEILLNFTGTVLLVSHDRKFMDNIVTNIMVMQADGKVREYVGGYADWVAKGGQLQGQSGKREKTEQPVANNTADELQASTVQPGKNDTAPKKKRSYKDQRELESLPANIEKLERKQASLEAQIAEPDFYSGEHKNREAVLAELEQINSELEKAYARWTELEG